MPWQKKVKIKFKKILLNNKYQWLNWSFLLLILSIPTLVLAAETENSRGFLGIIDTVFSKLVEILGAFLFFEVAGFPLIVLWLICGSIFFTVKMGFINIRGFKHAIDIVMGKYDDPNDDGEVSHFQALATALSGTVGLGNIAGVAISALPRRIRDRSSNGRPRRGFMDDSGRIFWNVE